MTSKTTNAPATPPPQPGDVQDSIDRPTLAELRKRADELGAQIHDHLARGEKK
ncbi:hypothetical protein [Streptomyces sp. XD-27]|uniref:hypothetical protein n=1 Tax=Streptomyces sp. XD-27 TaxID=3062779 RepID=UPI0026F4653D|nr:hypothetical protein [Streptomyces sp. XD-27]WKX68879.1 hypothetical protein Q3Y56_02165 [Streptomyces sp. XD-27]